MTHRLLVRRLRRARELTLAAVSKETGIDPATISRIERGRLPGTAPQRYALAGFFGRPAAVLFAPVEDDDETSFIQ